MKKYIIIIFITLFLFSCGKNNEKEIGVIEETGKIMSGYIDTLESSISDAKKVKKILDDKYNILEK